MKSQLQKIAVSGFILNSQNKFLIVKRSKNDDFLPGFWEIPGGKLEFGEDVITGIKREIKEEAGIDILPEYPLIVIPYIIENKTNEHHYVVIIYLCKMENPNQKITLSEEHEDYKWISFEDLPNQHILDLLKETLNKLKTHPLVKRHDSRVMIHE